MSIVGSEVISNVLQVDGTRQIRYRYTFDTGKVVYYGPAFISGSADADADMAVRIPEVELNEAWVEINTQLGLAVNDYANPDKVPPEYQGQEDFDRRLLGQTMLLTNIHEFYAAYPFFEAMELRSGANANQRAATLGVTTVEYGEVEDRYNGVSGIAWALDDIKNEIWPALPSEDWL